MSKRLEQYTFLRPCHKRMETAGGMIRYDDWCEAEAARLSRRRDGVIVRHENGHCAVWGPRTRPVQ